MPELDQARVRERLRLRRLWLGVHRWFGLTLGTLLAILALTGSVIGFWEEIYEWTDPELVVPAAPGGRAALGDVLAGLKNAHPQRAKSWELWLPRTGQSVLWAIYDAPEEKGDAYAATLLVAIDPITARPILSWYWGETWLSWFYNVHAFLAAGRVGEKIVGLSGVLVLVSLGTGIFLWWPPGHWRRSAFAPARGADPARVEFDVHRLTGLYTLPVVAVISVTGSMLIFAGPSARLIGLFSTVEDLHPHVRSAPLPGAQPVAIDDAARIAQAEFPDAQLKRIRTPATADAAWHVVLRRPQETFNQSHTYTQVWIDQYSGAVLRRIDPAVFNAGTALMSWRLPFHSGEAFGTPGKLAVSAIGLVLVALYATGLLQWWRRRRIRRRLAATA